MELADARKPVSAAGDRIIFVGVPEGEIIDRINRRHAVIAPASAGMGLVTAARDHDGFPLTEIVQCIPSQSASIADGRLLGRTRGRITDGHVPVLIHGDARHPAP